MGYKNEESLRGIIEKLNVGDSHVFPIERLMTLRTTCSTYGAIWNRKFRCSIDRAARAVIVLRVE